MDFSLTEEQSMLADSVARLIDNDYGFESRQVFAASDKGYSGAIWQTMGELGLTALPFSEADGGLDGGPVETMLVMEQFGRGLVLEPYLASVIMAGGVISASGNSAQKEKWLTDITDGSRIGALAFTEPQSRFRLNSVATKAVSDDSGFVINGHKSVVLDGGSADFLVVSARTSGEIDDDAGISLFVVDRAAAGVSCEDYPTVDGMRAAEIRFENVTVDEHAMLGTADEGLDTLTKVIDDATLAVCAEALGIMQSLNEKTLEYTKNRQQFGLPIAAFQALQHRMVDMFVDFEQTRSLLLWAVMERAADKPDSSVAISAVKQQIGTAGRKLGQEAIQLHGGMGVTWELDVAHYFKRLTTIDTLFGNADFHLQRYSAMTG